MALDATIGGASADSFVSVADADTYIDTRLNVTAWTGAATADKERALKSATRELNLLAYQGVRYTTTQALAWPRDGCPNPDASGGEDAFYDEDVIPERIEIATTELALQYLKAGTTDLSEADPQAGVIRKKIGPLDTEWASGTAHVTGWAKYPIIGDALGPLLAAQPGTSWVRS